jgi:Ca2+-binding EF-hand superfamily protein
MTINALFGAATNRDGQVAGNAKSGNADSTFAAALAGLKREFPQAEENLSEKAGAASSETPSSASNAGTQNSGAPNTSLGADARGIAGLAAAGVTVTVQSIASLNLPSGLSPSSPEYQQDLIKALQAKGAGSSGDTMSQSTFESLVEKFGGTKAQADQLFSQLGGSGTATVSNAKMLQALGATSSDPTSATSQMLLGLMDANGDREVSSNEFTQFETAMVDEERSTSV